MMPHKLLGSKVGVFILLLVIFMTTASCDSSDHLTELCDEFIIGVIICRLFSLGGFG